MAIEKRLDTGFMDAKRFLLADLVHTVRGSLGALDLTLESLRSPIACGVRQAGCHTSVQEWTQGWCSMWLVTVVFVRVRRW